LSNTLFRNAELSRGAARAALGGARCRGGRSSTLMTPYDPMEFADEDDEFWPPPVVPAATEGAPLPVFTVRSRDVGQGNQLGPATEQPPR